MKSLCNQTIPFFEIIIVNDGSKDRTEELVLEYSHNNRIKNIIVYSIKNSGVASARNFGISKSRGNFIAFVDSDDFVEPTFCETLLFPFETDSNCDLSICSVIRFAKESVSVKKKYLTLDSN
ncbi:TPA: glycosyltransferase family A protein, partial [Streptococcus suis]